MTASPPFSSHTAGRPVALQLGTFCNAVCFCARPILRGAGGPHAGKGSQGKDMITKHQFALAAVQVGRMPGVYSSYERHKASNEGILMRNTQRYP